MAWISLDDARANAGPDQRDALNVGETSARSHDQDHFWLCWAQSAITGQMIYAAMMTETRADHWVAHMGRFHPSLAARGWDLITLDDDGDDDE